MESRKNKNTSTGLYGLFLKFVFILAIVCAPAVGDEVLRLPLDNDALNNSRIDLRAQQSIARLSNGNARQHRVAHYLLDGVRNGALGGIYPVNHKVPEQRARWIGKRWQELRESKSARCWKSDETLNPLIIIDEAVIDQPKILDASLVKAFTECGFREVEVIVKKQISNPFIPCAGDEADVWVFSATSGVAMDAACHTDRNGVCHFALPPAVYMFEVRCNNDPTSPEVIFRSVKAGEGVQREGFNNLFWVSQKWEKFKEQ